MILSIKQNGKECLINMSTVLDIDLTPFFKTKAQAIDFSSRIASISAKIYEANFNLEQILLDEFGIQKKDKFMSLLRNSKVNPESSTALKAFLTKVQETTNTLPVLSLTLAFEPKDKTLQVLSEWFMMNIKKQMLFEITVDKQIIAGANINYKGRFLEASIRPIFDKMLVEMTPGTGQKTSGDAPQTAPQSGANQQQIAQQPAQQQPAPVTNQQA